MGDLIRLDNSRHRPEETRTLCIDLCCLVHLPADDPFGQTPAEWADHAARALRLHGVADAVVITRTSINGLVVDPELR